MWSADSGAAARRRYPTFVLHIVFPVRYARADLDLKRHALAQLFPDAVAPPRGC